MALNTLATNAALQALVDNNTTPANIGALAALITDDKTGLLVPGAFEFAGGNGLLYVPRRGVLKCFPGDWVGVDSTGWPILVSSNAAGTAAAWTHN